MKLNKDSYLRPPYTTYRYGKPMLLNDSMNEITIVGLEDERERIIVREPIDFCDSVDCVAILKDMIRRDEKDVSKEIH